MEERIQELFEQTNRMAVDYMVGYNRKNVKAVKELLPKIQWFAQWFLESNAYGIEPEMYQQMCCDFMQILKDILEAVSQEDHVLLHDAVAYGLLEYLKMFTGQEGKQDDSL